LKRGLTQQSRRIIMRVQAIRSSCITAALISAALLSGCASTPSQDAELDQAQSVYQVATTDPKVAQAAPEQLRKASDAINQSTTLQKQGAPQADVDHYAHLAIQETATAQQLANADASQAYIKQSGTQRNQVLLQASQQQTQQAQIAAQNANAQAQQAQMQAAAATAQADQANLQNAQLQQQLAALDARQTDRGLVLTLGSVLFDTDKTELKSGGEQSLDKLSQFLRDNPKRNVIVEGYTDSSGNADSNLGLSGRRADAVRSALVNTGVGSQRIATKGFGVDYPVASNATAAGRQQNRRVEIVISDANGDFPEAR
jgi:outer membrane protein OmpA-like peptidoglycan-associated protein